MLTENAFSAPLAFSLACRGRTGQDRQRRDVGNHQINYPVLPEVKYIPYYRSNSNPPNNDVLRTE